MSKIAIIGFGELGKQLKSFLEDSGKTDFIYFDDHAKELELPNSFAFSERLQYKKEVDYFIALGYKHLTTKKDILTALQNLKKRTPSFIHTSCYINNSAKVSEGAFLYPMCNIDKEVLIEAGCLLNNSVVISHNSVIGSCSYLSPGVVISGNVSIGECTFIGSGAIISNNVKIGDNVIVGAGTVITNDVPDSCSVIGNPMRILNKKLNIT